MSGYEFYFKIDDDVYCHLENLNAKLQTLKRDSFLYIGREMYGFMVGMVCYAGIRPRLTFQQGYGISRRAVGLIAESKYTAANISGQEDWLVSSWMTHFQREKKVDIERIYLEEYYDHPSYGNDSIWVVSLR